MSARRTLRRLLPFLLLALLGALVARQRAAKKAPESALEPLQLPPVEVAVESTTEEISIDSLLAAASEPVPVEVDLVVAEAVPDEQIAVLAVQEEDATVHIVTVVDDLLSGPSAEESASISR